MQTALRHQRQQADGLQSHGFAAGVGSCDDHGIEVGAQPQGDGHHLLGVDQRMAGIAELHPAGVIHNGRPGPHFVGQLCLCEDDIQLHQQTVIQIDVLGMSSRLTGQLRQNPLNFLLLLQLQLPQCVVGIHSGHGLHEISRAGGGDIMHQTGNIIFTFGFHGYHIPSLTDGDDGFPKELAVSRRGNNLLKAVPDFSGLNAHMAADVRQFRGCGVRNFLLRKNRTEDSVFQIFIGSQSVEQRIQDCGLVVFRHIALDGSGTAEHSANGEQLFGLEAAAPVRPFQAGRHIAHIGEDGVPLSGAKVGGCCCLLEQQLHFLQIGDGTKLPAALLSALASGAFGQQRKHLIQLQLDQGFFI